jgi:hypothetical protein
MAKKISETSTSQNPSQESIARRAYEIWQAEGCPEGRAMEHWLRAVSELRAHSNGAQPEEPQDRARAPRRSTTPRAEKRFQTTSR